MRDRVASSNNGIHKRSNECKSRTSGRRQGWASRQRYERWALSSAWLVLVSALLTGCHKDHKAGYTFETTPRAVLAQEGVAPSRSGRVGVDWVSSPTVRLLAVLGDGDNARLGLLNSEDGGDTFDKPIWVSEAGKDVSSSGESSEAFVSTPKELYAAWNQGDELWFARSITWGSSFEKPIKITDGPAKSFSGYPSLGVAPNGDLYAVWIDTRDQTDSEHNYAVYLARSTDHGATFGKNVRVAEKICPCCRPTLSFGSSGEVMVFWRHVYPGSIRDMTVAVSTDGGQTFSAPKKVAEDNWKLSGCPDSGAATAHVGNRVYVAWLTEASPDKAGVRMTWTDDGGKSWAPAIMASQQILDANYPWFSVTEDGRALLVFQGRDPQKQNGWSGTGVYLVEIAADGKISEPLGVPGIASSAKRPSVTAGMGGRVYITWNGEKDGAHAVFLSRARRTGQQSNHGTEM